VSISEHKHVPELAAAPVQRIEVFTGAGRRRSWTPGEKASIVAESYAEGSTACQVARRHGLTPQQLFTWRRQARRPAVSTDSRTSQFVPAVVEKVLPERGARGRRRKRTGQMDRTSGSIEVEIEGVTVRIGLGAEAKTVAAVLRALKAGP
jgi:transposase